MKNPDPLYFQEIAGAFLARRGAPLILSPRDLELIASWERAGIPLAAVLEGIENAMAPAGRPGPRRPVLTLAFCGREVERAFARHRDRLVGRAGRTPDRAGKRSRARAEVARFLKSDPPPAPRLTALAGEALALLDSDDPDSEALERLDAAMDEALLETAGGESPAPSRSSPAAARKHLVKRLREEKDIPRFALFHY